MLLYKWLSKNLFFVFYSKAMSLSEPGSTSKATGLGIVCKKEDLKAILCTATSKKFPLASPKKKNRLRQTKSASFEPSDESSVRKEPVRRAGSEETRTRRFEHNESKSVDSDIPSEQQVRREMLSRDDPINNRRLPATT